MYIWDQCLGETVQICFVTLVIATTVTYSSSALLGGIVVLFVP